VFSPRGRVLGSEEMHRQSTMTGDDDVVERGILLVLWLIGAAMGKEEER